MEAKWSATGEALKVNAHEQQWNMAVCGPEGKTPEGLVAMVFGYSPEGVARRASLIAASPALAEAAKVAADRLVDQRDEPNAALDRLHYWRDKAIDMSRYLRAALDGAGVNHD